VSQTSDRNRTSGVAEVRKETPMHLRWYCPILIAFTMVVASPHARGNQVPTVTPAEREALAAVVRELDAAYDAQDVDRFVAVFAEGASFQFPVDGLALRGREEIRQHFATQFATLPPFRHVTTTGDVELVGPGILAVDVQVDIRAVDPKTGAAETLFHYAGLGLGTLTDSGWRIRLVRLYPAPVEPAPAARTPE
jgi:uncharacterized protein (TIGR02246 family)